MTIGNNTSGSSSFNALEVKVEKRLSFGLNMLASYTNGRLIDSGGDTRLSFLGSEPGNQDNNNLRLERSISPQSVSQHLTIAGGYELPIGAGKPLWGGVKGWQSRVISGWQVNAAQESSGRKSVRILSD